MIMPAHAPSSSWLYDLRHDLRIAMRTIARAPLFALLVVGILGLGVGAATATWALVDGIVLRPFVFPQVERLHALLEETPSGGKRPVSYPTFQDWKARATAFERLAYVRGEDLTLPEAAGVRRIVGAYVSDDYFATLGVPAHLGRTFGAGDADARPIVLGWRFWQQRFGGDRSVLGQAIRSGAGTFTVVGVMPAALTEPAWADVYLPIEALPPASRYVLTARHLHVDAQAVGRLKPGVTRAQAEAQMATLAAGIAAAYPDDAADWTRVSLTPLKDAVLGDAATRLRVLVLVVALVLLVTLLNAAGLLVARQAVRERELAVRTALGARAGRLVRQLLAETALLAVAGGAAGVGVGALLLAALRRWAPQLFPRLAEVQLDVRALAFVVAVVTVVALVLALLPARTALRRSLTDALRQGGAGSGTGRASARLRGALVVAQVAMALVVAVSAGLLARTLTVLADVPLGVRPDGVLALRVFTPREKYDDPRAALDLYRRLEEALAAVPGVEVAALANHFPFAGGLVFSRVRTSAPPAADGSDIAAYRTVSPRYLAAMGGTLTRGRFLTDEDLIAVGSGVVVNEAFVRRYYRDQDPLGAPVTVFRQAQGRADLGTPVTASIVGVIGDERIYGTAVDAPPIVYVPYTWDAWPSISVAVRTALPLALVAPRLNRALLEVEPAIPIATSSPVVGFRPLAAFVDDMVQGRRVSTWSLSAFSAVTLLLAAVGIFGVMAFVVVQRGREIGLRLALGATPASVSRWVLWQALRLAIVGVALGIVAAAALTRVLQSQLVGVTATDPLVYGSAALLFSAVAVAAALLPAWRAARVDPVGLLRAD